MGYAGIVPGKPLESLIIQRMITDDQDDLMPPPDSNRKVTKEQIEQIADINGQILEETYVDRIEAYTDEEVVFKKEKIQYFRK